MHVIALAVQQVRQGRVDVRAIARNDVDLFGGQLLLALLV
jgi:hypothetical protein